jgi:hypothetical protein
MRGRGAGDDDSDDKAQPDPGSAHSGAPMVPGQWVPRKKWMHDFAVVDNRRYPLIPVQAKMMPLEA